MIGKCPYCGNNVARLDGNGVTVSFGLAGPRKAVTYNCPSCHAVLSCEIDPVALRAETVAQTVDELLTKLRQC